MKQRKLKIIKIVLASVVGVLSSYLIYESVVPKEYSAAYKSTHYKIDRGIKEIELRNLYIKGDSTKIIDDNEYHQLKYNLIPYNTSYPEVEIETNAPSIIKIKDESFKVVPHDYNESSEPLTITVRSTKYPKIHDTIEIIPKLYLSDTLTYTVGDGITTLEDGSYQVETYKPFFIDFKAYDTNGNPSNEEIKITNLNNGLVRMGTNWFYATKPCDLAEIYLNSGIALNTVQLKVIESETFIKPDEFNIYEEGVEGSISNLTVGKSYSAKLFKEKHLLNIPYSLTSSNENIIKIENMLDIVPVDEGKATITLKVHAPNDVTYTFSKEVLSSHVVTNPVIEYNRRFNQKQKALVLDINETSRFTLDFHGGTYQKYKVESKDPEVVKILDNGYFKALAPGKTSITISPLDEKHSDIFEPITFNVNVNNNILTVAIDSNVVIGIYIFVIAILATVLIYFIFYDKKYLRYLPITFAFGFILTGLFSLLALASPFINSTIGLFGINLSIYIAGAGLVYIIYAINHSYCGYNFEKRPDIIDVYHEDIEIKSDDENKNSENLSDKEK